MSDVSQDQAQGQGQGQNPYLRDAVMTATPEQLQLMLYDGCIRYALQARDAVERRDYETSCDKLIRAQHIILEMQNGLNHEVNPKLCERVAAIYGFIYHKLIDASVQRDAQAIDDALKVLRIERETWQILVDKVNKARQAGEEASDPSARQDEAAPISFSAEG
jgi:flagellar protein FliS